MARLGAGSVDIELAQMLGDAEAQPQMLLVRTHTRARTHRHTRAHTQVRLMWSCILRRGEHPFLKQPALVPHGLGPTNPSRLLDVTTCEPFRC